MEKRTNLWKIAFVVLIILLLLAAINFSVWYFVLNKKTASPPASGPTPISTSSNNIACTQDAMLCPDGKTYVSRIPPSCEFAPCPATSTTSKAEDEKAIKEAVLRKLNSKEADLKVTIQTQTDKHAKGSVVDIDGIGGGYFIAAKTDSGWVIVHDGQANPTCSQIALYNFPADMVPECLNSSGNIVKR